eukprot:TRINITY_DN33881_c0_g2_i1.p1 TRINITY_DN33881_c0_g2~~TRINITY_DN33881_c0_g2_i1.p1  ORF type:complete len:2156 (+),score=390.66 TRINITY_DN33881_c0_g2_i1:490-6468(+)
MADLESGNDNAVFDAAGNAQMELLQRQRQPMVSAVDDAARSLTTSQDHQGGRAPCCLEGGNLELCKDIARLKAVDLADIDSVNRSWRGKDSGDETTRSLQQTVQGAVKRLAADLYSTETHFLLELLQNVDDCTFLQDQTPCLKMVLEDCPERFSSLTSLGDARMSAPEAARPKALLALEYNETGFAEQNVRALCDIAKSTKTTEQRKFIGAKGIGFKSVFRITRTPVVHSGQYHFHFDSAALDGLGYLIPFPLSPAPGFESTSHTAANGCSGTRLVLPLHESRRLSEVRTHIMEDVQPTLLLFLRNLCSIDVLDTSAGFRKSMSKCMDGNILTLTTLKQNVSKCFSPEPEAEKDRVERWMVHTHPVEVDSLPEKVITELKLAFHLEEEGSDAESLIIGSGSQSSRPTLQQAFAWLPLRSYGFRFIVQADWVVPSSREAITETDPFNQFIRDALPAAFADATASLTSTACSAAGEEFVACSRETLILQAAQGVSSEARSETALQRIEHLKRTLIHLYGAVPLPGEASEFFAPTPKAILHELQRVPFVLARGGGSDIEGAAEEPAALQDANDKQQQVKCRLVMIRPLEAVLNGISPQVPMQWSDRSLQLLEPLLNAAGRHVEIGILPHGLAEALGVPFIDTHLAVECLGHFAQQFKRPVTEKHLEILHLLFLIVASDPSPALLSRLARLPVIPMDDGHLAAAEGQTIYNIGSDFQAVVPGTRTVSSRFADMMHQQVTGLLARLGVERADGVSFYQQMLLPFLTGSKRPPLLELVNCTKAARQFLQGLDEVQRQQLLGSLQQGMWVVVAGQVELEIVFIDATRKLHLQPLPDQLVKAYPYEWLCVSDAYLHQQASNQRIQGVEAEISLWKDFWLSLGAWPAFSIEQQGDNGDWVSTELESLIRCLAGHTESVSLTHALLEFIAPHGSFYGQYLTKSNLDGQSQEMQDASCFATFLKETPWLPTRGGDLVRASDSWLPPTSMQPSPLEEPLALSSAVEALKLNWPVFTFRSEPTLSVLVAVIRCQAEKGSSQHSVRDLRCFYARLANALSAVSVSQDRATEEAVEFLNRGSWVFVPDHPRLVAGRRDAYDSKGERVLRHGSWQPIANLVFKDPSRLIDTYSKAVPDAASDLARTSSGKRVIGQYYWGPYTLFPANWSGERFTREHSDVQEFFRSLGVRDCVSWSSYVDILASVDERAREQLTCSDKKQNDMLCCVLHIFGYLLEEVDRELYEFDTSGDVRDQDMLQLQQSHVADATTSEQKSQTKDDEKSGVAKAAVARLDSHFCQSQILRNFVASAAALRCVPTAAGDWRQLGHVQFLDDHWSSDWQGPALGFVAALPSNLELQSWGSERLRRALHYCGLSSSPMFCRQARLLSWSRGSQAALASAVLLAGARWAAEEALLPSVEGFGEMLKLESRRIDFVEVPSEADITDDQGEAAALMLEELVAVDATAVIGDTKHFLPRATCCPGELLLESQTAEARLTEGKQWLRTRPAAALDYYVGKLQKACIEQDEQRVLADQKKSPKVGSLVAAFTDTATEALATPFATTIVALLVDQSVQAATEKATFTMPACGSHESDSVKRKLLKRVQQVAAQLQLSPPRRLEPPAVAVERACRQAGFAGAGHAEDLLPPWASLLGNTFDSDKEAYDARRRCWAEVAISAETMESHTSEIQVHTLDQDHFDNSNLNSLSNSQGSNMLASALKALGSGGKSDVSSHAKSSFPASLPLGPTREAAGPELPPGLTPPPGLEADGKGAGPASGSTSEVRQGRPLSAGFGIGDRSAVELEKQLITMLRTAEECKLSSENLKSVDDHASIGAEVQLSPEARAVMAQLAELPEDEFTEVVGRVGEEAAMQALRLRGFEVAWVNKSRETGLPFDLILRPAPSHGSAPGRELTEWPAALAALLEGKAMPSLKEIEVALASVPGAAIVEVKASLAAARGDVFEISSAQLAVARRLGDRYWLARVRKLSEGIGQINVLKDVDRATRDGRVKLLMVA